MGRLPRTQILYDGCYAHVFTRSLEKRHIFVDSDDFRSFSEILLRMKKEYDFRIFHYCLMNSHFHLVVGMSSVERFSKAMQAVKWEYTKQFNRKYRHHGPLWRERFKSLLVENEGYLYACGQYIEQNPIKARLVQEAGQWEYSSAKHYLNMRRDDLIDNYEKSQPTEEVDLNDDIFFLRGGSIGSGWFKYQLKKGIWVSPKR